MKSIIRNHHTNHHDRNLTITWQTPIGPLRGVIGEKGLRGLHFPVIEDQTLASSTPGQVKVSRTAWSEPGGQAPGSLLAQADEVTRWLQDYFAGRSPAGKPRLDWSVAGEFDRLVWQGAQRIPPGQTRTYGQVAARIGRPRAPRAVGGALGRNPFVLIVPCHRVVAAAPGTRGLGGFTGGLALKKYLLGFEREDSQYSRA